LESAPKVAEGSENIQLTGSELVKVMQAMPYREDVEFEHSRQRSPVRDVQL
jgi:hypothetical protein